MDALEKKYNFFLFRKRNRDSSVVKPTLWLPED
jgi:hypothetical protein